MTARDMSPTLEYSLGVNGTKTKVDMGPLEHLKLFELDPHRVLIYFSNKLTVASRITHSFSNINHP